MYSSGVILGRWAGSGVGKYIHTVLYSTIPRINIITTIIHYAHLAILFIYSHRLREFDQLYYARRTARCSTKSRIEQIYTYKKYWIASFFLQSFSYKIALKKIFFRSTLNNFSWYFCITNSAHLLSQAYSGCREILKPLLGLACGYVQCCRAGAKIIFGPGAGAENKF